MRTLPLRSSLIACVWMVLVSAAPGFRLVEPFPRVQLEVPAGWQEHRRESDVLYTPPGLDYRARSLAYGVRIFVEQSDTTNVARRLEALMVSYSKANAGIAQRVPRSSSPG